MAMDIIDIMPHEVSSVINWNISVAESLIEYIYELNNVYLYLSTLHFHDTEINWQWRKKRELADVKQVLQLASVFWYLDANNM